MPDTDNSYLQLLNIMVSDGQYDNKKHLGFTRYHRNYAIIKGDAFGIMRHYTSLESLQAIIKERCLRLTRFDKMTFGGDEGTYVYDTYAIILQELHKEKKISAEQYSMLLPLTDNKTLIVYHNDRESDRYLPCVPYIICFSQGSFDNLRSDFIKSRDLYIECFLGNNFFIPNLQPLNYDSGDLRAHDNWGKCEFKIIDYGSKALKKLLRTYILRCIHEISSFDVAIEGISMKLNELRMRMLPPKYSIEKELRLIYYKPIDYDTFEPKNCPLYEYFNFSDQTVTIDVVFNREVDDMDKDLIDLSKKKDITLNIQYQPVIDRVMSKTR